MGYFQVRYDSRIVNYDRRGFIRLATGLNRCPALGPVLALLVREIGQLLSKGITLNEL